jgi:hypothetical protein
MSPSSLPHLNPKIFTLEAASKYERLKAVTKTVNEKRNSGMGLAGINGIITVFS